VVGLEVVVGFKEDDKTLFFLFFPYALVPQP